MSESELIPCNWCSCVFCSEDDLAAHRNTFRVKGVSDKSRNKIEDHWKQWQREIQFRL